jgi:hypothetical protein
MGDVVTDSIRILCDAPAHAGKVVEIETFAKTSNGGWRIVDRPVTGDPFKRGLTGPDWQEKAVAQLKPATRERVTDAGKVFTGRLAAADLPGLTDAERAAIGHDGSGYVRYRLHCPLCGLDFQRREEKLLPVFDRAASMGVTKFRLSELAANL